MKQISRARFSYLKLYFFFSNTSDSMEAPLEKRHTRKEDKKSKNLCSSFFSFELNKIDDFSENVRFCNPDYSS